MKCDVCKKENEVNIHSDSNSNQTLCTECMEEKGLVWDRSESEFTPEYIDCPDCGGKMVWCSCCEMYSQICCIDFGTCQCS